MKRTYRSLIIASLIVLVAAGCAGQTPATAPAATPAASNAGPVPASGTVSASAVVEPVHTSNMAFLIGGPVKQINVKAGDSVKAGQPLIVLDTPALEYAVAAAQAELQSAKSNETIQKTARKSWNGFKFVYLSGPPELRQIASARVVQAQAALDAAQANLSQGTLVAPFDGTVASINIDPGEMVTPQQTVLVLGDLSQLQVATTDLSEREIAAVQIGQKATTKLKAFDQDLTGTVVAIAPMSTLSNGDHVFKVTIQLDQQPKGLLWGMSGDVSIATK